MAILIYSVKHLIIRVLEDTWVGCYEGIKRCNIVLDNIESVQMDETAKKNV